MCYSVDKIQKFTISALNFKTKSALTFLGAFNKVHFTIFEEVNCLIPRACVVRTGIHILSCMHPIIQIKSLIIDPNSVAFQVANYPDLSYTYRPNSMI